MKPYLLWTALLACALALLAREGKPAAVSAASLPKVVMHAESLAPRSIEQRTGEMVTDTSMSCPSLVIRTVSK